MWARTLEQVPRPTIAAALAVGVCLLVRLAFMLWPDAFLAVPESELQQLYTQNELRYRTGEQPHPKVIVAGTSRLGILPGDRLAASLGYEPDEVASYALAGNTFWRTLVFFRRNPGILADAEVVILDLFPFQLYEGVLNTEKDEVLLRMATVEERLRVRRPLNRVRAMADLVLPIWSQRHSVMGWHTGIRSLRLDPVERYEAFIEDAMEAANYREALLGERQVETDVRSAVLRHAPPPEVCPIQAEALEDLIAILPDGCLLVLAWLPVHPEFDRMLKEDPNARASVEPFREFIEAVERPGVLVLWADNDSAKAMPGIGEFTREDFMDPVHYVESAADRVSDLLANAIKDSRQDPQN